MDPSFPESYVRLARLHLEHEEAGRALALLDKAETLAAGDGKPAAEIATLRGVALEQLGDRAAARRAYERAVSLVPSDQRARAGLARTGGDPSGGRW